MNDTALQYRFRNICEITPEILREIGIRAVCVDADNTLVVDSTLKYIDGAIQAVEKIKAAGIPVTLVTNTTAIRAFFIGRKLGVPYVSLCYKPSPRGILKAAKKMKALPEHIGMIGDQIFADVMAANRAGAIPLLVDPLKPEVLFGGHFRKLRRKETPILDKFDGEVGYYVDIR